MRIQVHALKSKHQTDGVHVIVLVIKLVCVNGNECMQWAATGKLGITTRRLCNCSQFAIASEGHTTRALMARVLVKSLAHVEGRGVQVKRNGFSCVAGVLHTMNAHRVIDVCTLVCSVIVELLWCHRPALLPRALLLRALLLQALLLRAFLPTLWPCIEGLPQSPIENLHEAVGVRMGMDAASLRFSPTKYNQVEFSISTIHQSSRISVCVPFDILGVVCWVGLVGLHQPLHSLDIGFSSRQFFMQGTDKLVQRFRGHQGIHCKVYPHNRKEYNSSS